MIKHTDLRRPSNDIPILAGQLLRELAILEQEGERALEPDLFRAYLSYALTLAWEGVSRGDLEAPRRILDHLLAAQPFSEAFQPETLPPVEQAAMEIHLTIQSLYLACEALEDRQVEVRLEQRQSESDRQILKILAENRDRYLQRADVFERFSTKLTAARVGQILPKLHQEGLLKRIQGRAQGNPSTSFYALSPKGIEVCQRLNLIPPPPESEAPALPAEAPAPAVVDESCKDALFDQVLSSLIDPSKDWRHRRIAAGLLTNYQGPREPLEAQLRDWLGRPGLDVDIEMLLRSILAAWTLPLSSFASVALEARDETKLQEELIKVVQSELKPDRLIVFKISQDADPVALGEQQDRPSKALLETVEKARGRRRSLMHQKGNSIACVFPAGNEKLALEIRAPKKAATLMPTLMEGLGALYYVGRKNLAAA